MVTTRIIKNAALLALVLAMTAPSVGEAGHLSFHFNNGHTGFSFGSGGWSVYSSSWFDPSWSLSYDSALAGYGEWIRVDGLGRVWRPWVSVGWTPYSHGRWVGTDLGWTWVSYEPWGYFPHHYGEWALSRHGWVWRPGYVYAPANVVWVTSSFHVGWYPRAPHGWSHYHRGYNRAYNRGYDRGYWQGREDAMHATYVGWNNFGAEDLSRHRASARSVALRSSGSRIQRLNAAPSRSEISRRGGVAAPVSVLERRHVRVGGRDVVVARPRDAGRSVERHADETVSRALPASISRRYQRRSPSGDLTSKHRSEGRSPSRINENRSEGSRNLRNSQERSSSRKGNVERSDSTERSLFQASIHSQSSRPAPSRTTSRSETPSQVKVRGNRPVRSTERARAPASRSGTARQKEKVSAKERPSSPKARKVERDSRKAKAGVGPSSRTDRRSASAAKPRSRRR